ncbi:MAG: stalk domain-containing protein [Firmicutes bacterium]|nr:stalk domain-containing protein [Bacillota bacterium]
MRHRFFIIFLTVIMLFNIASFGITANAEVISGFENAANGAIMLFIDSPIAFVNNSRVRIDSDNYLAETSPIIKDGRTLVPVRFITEALGAKVDWNEAALEVKISFGNKSISLTLNKREMNVNGSIVTLDVPAQTVNDRTLLPLRALVGALDKSVYWDDRGLIVISNDDRVFNDKTNPELIYNIIRSFIDQKTFAIAPTPDKILYVSVNGDDGNDGLTEATAFNSIQKALDAAKPGTKIKVKNGIYHEAITAQTTGTRENPIVLEAESRFGVVITGDRAAKRLVMPSLTNDIPSRYITFRGFIFSNTFYNETTLSTSAVHITTGWRLEDCKIEDCGMQALTAQSMDVATKPKVTEDIALIRSVVQDTGGKTMGTVDAKNSLMKDVIMRRGNQKLLSPIDDGGGFKNVRSQSETIDAMTAYDHNGNSMWYDLWNTNFVIKNSSSFANHGYIFSGKPAPRAAGMFMEISQGPAKIYNNLIHSNMGAGLLLGEAKNLTAFDNVIFNNYGSAIWLRDAADRGFSDSFEIKGWEIGERIALGAASFYNNKIQADPNNTVTVTDVSAFYAPGGLYDKGSPAEHGITFDSNIFEPGTDIFSWIQNGKRINYKTPEQANADLGTGNIGYYEKFLDENGGIYGIEPIDIVVGSAQVDRSTEYSTIDSAIAPYNVGDSMPVPMFRRSEIRGTDNNWHTEVFDLQGRSMALHIKDNALKTQFENEISIYTNIYPKYATVKLTSDAVYDFRAELVGGFTANPSEYGTVKVTEPKSINTQDRFPYAWGEPFTVKADASAAAGVKSVEFYVENSLVGRADTAPYEATVQNLTPGEYFLTARVTDMNGATSISEPVRIGVRKELDVTVTGMTFKKIANAVGEYRDALWADNVNKALRLTVNQDVIVCIVSNSSIFPTDFYEMEGSISTDWQDFDVYGKQFPAGVIQLPKFDGEYMVGVLGMGNTAFAESIAIVSPIEGTQVSPGQDAIIEAEVTFGNNFGVIELYNNDEKIGEIAEPPYTMNLGELPAGSHKIKAVKTDLRGRTAEAELNYSVSDADTLWITNITSKDNLPYEPVYNALNSNINMFVNRQDWSIKTIPEEFKGLTYIKSADGHRSNKAPGEQVAFDINKKCAVYVVFPDRKYKTSWLDEWEELEFYTIQAHYDAIYRKIFPAGRVVLGPTAATSSNASYFIIVVPEDNPTAPVISVINPTPNARVLENGALECQIKALSLGGSITKIEAFEGGKKLAETNVSPYRLYISGLSKGTHDIVFVATDDQERSTSTKPIRVEVVADDKLVISNIIIANGTQPPVPVVYDGLKRQGYTHTNSEALFRSVPPEHLEGQPFLMLDMKQKLDKSEDYVKFDVNMDVTVYVAYDVRIPGIAGYVMPKWLKGFTKTEEKISRDDYVLYKKDFPKGTVVIGGNAPVNAGCTQYIPIIVPKGR